VIRRYLLICWLILCGGVSVQAATFQALNFENLSLVNPITTTATPLNDTTLNSVIGAIGSARKDILITPGTWTIANNLTIPANVGLSIAPDAQFSVNSGRTLTINGPMVAPQRTIFAGTGDVRFGGLVEAITPHWFGAICDGTGNDQPALQKAIASASTSTFRVLQWPSATCRVTAALTLRQGLRIVGPSSEGGKLLVAGAGIKGLVYSSGSTIEANILVENLTIEGVDTTVGNLVEVIGTGGAYVAEVTLRNVRLRNTGTNGLHLDHTLQVRARDVRIQNFLDYGIYYKDSNTGVFDSLNLNANPGVGDAAFYCLNSGQFSLTNSAVMEGGSATPRSIIFEGCDGVSITAPFDEFSTAGAVVAQTTASHNILINGGHWHAGLGQVPFDFSLGALAHSNIIMRGITCVVADTNYCFKGVENVISMDYCHNRKVHLGGGTSHHFNPATVSPNVTCLEKGVNKVIVGGGLRIARATFPLHDADATFTELLSFSNSIDFSNLADGACETVTSTAAAVAVGDRVFPEWPLSLIGAGITLGVEATAADQLSFKRCNKSGAPTGETPPTSIRTFVYRFQNIQ
jgi:hypothetical protein